MMQKERSGCGGQYSMLPVPPLWNPDRWSIEKADAKEAILFAISRYDYLRICP